MNDKNLAVFVELVNDVGAAANAIAAAVVPKVAEFYGKKIVKADGGLTAAFTKAVPIHNSPERGWQRVTYRVYSTGVSLWLNVKGCAPYGSSCIYHEEEVYLGNLMSSGILNESEATRARGVLRTDWTVAEVLAARQRYAEAEEAMREARRACGPFGER